MSQNKKNMHEEDELFFGLCPWCQEELNEIEVISGFCDTCDGKLGLVEPDFQEEVLPEADLALEWQGV